MGQRKLQAEVEVILNKYTTLLIKAKSIKAKFFRATVESVESFTYHRPGL